MSRHDLALAQESCRGHGTFSPLLTANVCITRHETFNSVLSIYSIAMSLGSWFCMSRKGGTGGGGLVDPESKNSMAMYGLAASVGPFLLLTSPMRGRGSSNRFVCVCVCLLPL